MVYQAIYKQKKAETLLGYDYAQFLKVFRLATSNLNWDVVPYQARHSGASADRAERLRPQDAVQKRGRWAALRSVRRYQKAGRLSQSWSRLNQDDRAHCEACMKMVEDVVLRGSPAPVPPHLRQ